MKSGDHRRPIISLRNACVRYSGAANWVGQPLNLNIHAGEAVLLLGPSGCGKTTIMMMLAGLVPSSINAELAGSAILAGVDTGLSAACVAGKVGIVFQDPDAQVVTSSLLDEVSFGLENLLVPVKEIEPRALAALKLVGLADHREQALRDPAQLSGGGRQRLALACAIAMDPPVLLLDEPTANLDPVASAELYSLLASLKSPQRAIVIVEHELDDAIPIADRVVVLDQLGRIAHDGSPQDVFGRHARELQSQGIWLPHVIEMALRLQLDRRAKCPLPLSADALSLALQTLDHGPAEGEVVSARSIPSDRDQAVLIRTEKVFLTIDGDSVLANIDLEVFDGDFLAIAGTNGAGKSSLLQAISGLLPIDSGTIERGELTLPAPASNDSIAYVFQNPEHQFVTNSVWEELAYGLRLRKAPLTEIQRLVAGMLDRIGLTAHSEKSPFLLSHGEKRRLSVASAVITRPRLLILDEPTFGQDRANGHRLMSLVADLNDAGTTIIVVTHDLQVIADYAQRVAVLTKGRLLRTGSTAEILCDDALIEHAGLRPPPLRRIANTLRQTHPHWEGLYRTGQVLEGRR